MELKFTVVPRGLDFRVVGIPAVVNTTSTGKPWEWGMPLSEW